MMTKPAQTVFFLGPSCISAKLCKLKV